jgi:hypothetical protein
LRYDISQGGVMKGPHVSLYFGTARNNLEGFNPSKKECLDRNGLRRELPENWFKKKGIRFVRMNTTKESDGIDYVELDEYKRSNVPILVSIDDVIITKPVQIVGRHVGDPKRNQFEGNPGLNYITDTGARELLKDAKAANPDQKNLIEQIYEKYFGHQF